MAELTVSGSQEDASEIEEEEDEDVINGEPLEQLTPAIKNFKGCLVDV